MTEQSISEPPHGKIGRLRLVSAIGAVALVAVVVVFCFGQETRGRSLESITS